MFRTFFIRCFTSFARNPIVSLLPLAMPAIFLMIMLEATGTAGAAPMFRLGVDPGLIGSATVERIIESGVVSVDELVAHPSRLEIDASRYDGLLLHDRQSGGATSELLVREGFEPWARVALSGLPRAVASGDVAVQSISTSTNSYLAFMLPGLFVMVLIQLSMTSTASTVLNDRADGTFRMIATAKGALFPLLSAELLFRLAFVCICFVVMMMIVSRVAPGWLGARTLEFTAVFVLGALMMVAMGYTLGGLLPGRRNWSAVITVLGLMFWFFTDILFQASQHAIARPIALMLPPTYMTDALRQISTGRPGTFPLMADVAIMAAWLAGFIVLSLRFFRFETNDDRL